MEPELEDQVTPKSTNSSQPSKKASGAAKAKQQVSQQQHPKKAFQKMNGTSKGPNSELSTLPSVPNPFLSPLSSQIIFTTEGGRLACLVFFSEK